MKRLNELQTRLTMYSSENVCNLIKKQRCYQKLNHLHKSICIKIDSEDDHVISVKTNFTYNKITSCLNFASSIIYRTKNIAPTKYGKLDCKNLKTIEMFARKDHKYKTTNAKTLNKKTVEQRHLSKYYERNREKLNAQSLELYHLNKEKINARRRELYKVHRMEITGV